VEMLKEDMEVLGPVRSREVAQAQQEILNLARRLELRARWFSLRLVTRCWRENNQLSGSVFSCQTYFITDH